MRAVLGHHLEGSGFVGRGPEEQECYTRNISVYNITVIHSITHGGENASSSFLTSEFYFPQNIDKISVDNILWYECVSFKIFVVLFYIYFSVLYIREIKIILIVCSDLWSVDKSR